MKPIMLTEVIPGDIVIYELFDANQKLVFKCFIETQESDVPPCLKGKILALLDSSCILDNKHEIYHYARHDLMNFSVKLYKLTYGIIVI